MIVKNKYILIGIPHVGKSTLGRRAAEVLQLPFYDIDEMVREGLKINSMLALFRANFDGSFMEAQGKAVLEVMKIESPAIVSTGAEVPLISYCSNALKVMGTIIHIQRDIDLIIADLKKAPQQWVLREARGSGVELEIPVQEHGAELYAMELPSYEELADLTLENNGTEDEGLEKLLDLLRANKIDEQ